MFPVLILGIVGFLGFGATLHYKTHWIGPVLCFGIANLTKTSETGCIFGYIIDSYEDLSGERCIPRFYLLFRANIQPHIFRGNQCSQSADLWVDLLCE
jgi:hypothetical protein